MFEFFLILVPIFAAGLLRGGGVCAVICAPGLFPLITSRKRTAWQGLKIGLLFNLPRIALLAIMGAVVGYLSFTLLVNASWFQQFVLRVGQFSYILFGSILVIIGAVMYARTADRRAELKERAARKTAKGPTQTQIQTQTQAKTSEGNPDLGSSVIPNNKELESCTQCPRTCPAFSEGPCRDHDDPKQRLTWFQRLMPATSEKRESVLVLIWGALLGTACMAEISVLSLELPAFATIMGSFGANSLTAALYGGIAMMIFGIGASIPILVITAAAGQVSKKIDTESRLLALRTIGAVIMVMIGLVLVFSSLQGMAFI